MKDHYKTLNLKDNATEDEIKKSYRKLAAEFHPDRNKAANAETIMQEINEAHDTLKDPSKKEEYDLEKKFGGPNPFAGSPFSGGGHPGGTNERCVDTQLKIVGWATTIERTGGLIRNT